MKVKIEIDTKTFVRFWLVVIGFAFAIIAIYSARTALVLLGTAFFLAMALNAPVGYLARYLPGKSRAGGTAIAFVLVIAILGAVVFLVVPPVVQQTAKFIDTIPRLVDTATTQWQGLSGFIDRYQLHPQVDNALNSLKDTANHWTTDLGQNLLSGVGSILGLIASSFLVLVLAFLMLIEGPAWLSRIWGLYNNQEKMESHRSLVHRMYSVVTGYVTGQLTVSAIDALTAGAVVFILSLFFPQVPANLALPTMAIMFTLSLIPMFGATIGGVLITLLLVSNNISAGIIYLIYFIVYQQLENNFIAPAIQAKRVELSALTVLGSVTIGLYVFGLAGGIISIPIAGCLRVLLEEHLSRARKNRKKSEHPVNKIVKKIQNQDA